MKILDVPQSGSVAGTTSSRNRFGQYRRTRAVPVNPNTPAQQNARNRLSEFSAAWRGLTDEQREAWRSYANEHPVTDSLGQSEILTGLQVFCGVNSALAAAGFPAVDLPPTADAPDAPVITVADTDAATLEIDYTPTPVPADNAIVFESSPPRSAGVNFNADFRQTTVAAAADVSPASDAGLVGKWGSLNAGQKFFLRARMVRNDGAVSAFSSVSFILT